MSTCTRLTTDSNKRYISLEGAEVTLKLVNSSTLLEFIQDNKIQEYLVRNTPITFVHQNSTSPNEPCNCKDLGKAVNVLAKEKLSYNQGHFGYVPVEIVFQEPDRIQFAIAKIELKNQSRHHRQSSMRDVRAFESQRKSTNPVIFSSQPDISFDKPRKYEPTPSTLTHNNWQTCDDPMDGKCTQGPCHSGSCCPPTDNFHDMVLKVLLNREFGPHKSQIVDLIRDIAKENEVQPMMNCYGGPEGIPLCHNYSNKRMDGVCKPNASFDNILKSILISRIMQNQSMLEKTSPMTSAPPAVNHSPNQSDKKRRRSQNHSTDKLKSLRRVRHLVNRAMTDSPKSSQKTRDEPPRKEKEDFPDKVFEKKLLCGKCADCAKFYFVNNECHEPACEKKYEMLLTICKKMSPFTPKESPRSRHSRRNVFMERGDSPGNHHSRRKRDVHNVDMSSSGSGVASQACDFITTRGRINSNNNNPCGQEGCFLQDEVSSDFLEVPCLFSKEISEVTDCLFASLTEKACKERDEEEMYQEKRASVIERILKK
jgi:hypothetical protein